MESLPLPALDARPIACRPVRRLTWAVGVLCVCLGVIGIFVPVMPTTVFLLIALWCFSRSSSRMQNWLYNHPRLGRTLRDWHRYRVIPAPAKVAAIGTMAASLVVTCLLLAGQPWIPVLVAAILVPVAVFILSRPSGVVATAD